LRALAKPLGLAGTAFLAVLALATATRAQPAEPVKRIAVHAQAIEAFDPRDGAQTRCGALEFRGGLVLTSPHREFGGLSAIHVTADGARFLAVSDRGRWFRGRIVYRDGRPTALAEVETAPLLGANGKPLAAQGWYDAEALAVDGGTLYVSIERVNEIVRFDYGKGGLRARGQPLSLPPALKALPFNKGIECLAIPPKGLPLAGTLIALAERALDAQGHLRAFLLGGPQPGTFSLRRTNDFDVSDCVTTPRGDLLILERRFSWPAGVSMRIRRVPLAQLRPGALADGPELLFADMGHQIDNMEGLAVHRTAAGEIMLTLVSDNNFSSLQRTLLLQFALVGE